MNPLFTATLVTAAGAVVAQMPEAAIGELTRTAMTVETATVTTVVGTPAADAIIAADPLGLLEIQIRRDGRLVLWGPIMSAPVDFETGLIVCTVNGAAVHLDRTLTGPPELENLAPNPRFATDLADWSRWLTTTDIIAGVVWETFDEDVTQITWAESGDTGVPNAPTPDTNWAKFDGSGLTADEELQLYHDETYTASTIAPTRITIRACWWIPPGQTFGPPDPGEDGRTNLDHSMIATVHDTAGDFSEPAPIGYFAFEPVLSVTRWGDIFAGEYNDIECSVDIPQGTGDWRVHLALVPPRLVAYATLVEIVIDRPLDLAGTATGRVGDLIDHAQDPAYDHIDRNIVGDLIGSASTVVDEDPVMESDRRSVLQSIEQLAEVGRVEWRMVYTDAERTFQYGQADAIGVQHDEPVVLTGDRSPHIVTANLKRRPAYTSVTGQSAQGQVRSDAATATVADALGWEMAFVAPKWLPRWALAEWTATRHAEEVRPDVLTVTVDPTSPQAAPWLDGTIDVLDFVPVVVDRDGVSLDGWWQVREITRNPTTDVVVAQLVPEVT